jgi:hypothetical protein
MLTTIESVQLIPGFNNLAAYPVAFLNQLIGAADRAIKTYLKRDIEFRSYTEYYSGSLQQDIILKQYPVWSARTTIAAASNGASLPQATINVVSTTGFPTSAGLEPAFGLPVLTVQTSPSTYTTVTYTGVTSTSFTGCTGGTGTLSTGNRVGMPVVFFDPGGYYGQTPGGFAAGTQLVPGSQYAAVLDSYGMKSNQGLLRKIGGAGAGFIGFYPENVWAGKLAAYRLPVWPRGEGNLKVQYSAGYAIGEVPLDLQYAANLLVAYMARNLPSGSPLQSETLGAYSYTIAQGGQAWLDVPELGSLARTLAAYREVSW